MIKKRALILAFCALIVLAVSSAWAGEKESAREALARRIDSIVDDVEATGTWAIEVVSLETGETLYKKNSNRPLIPASNTKLFTTAAALYYLGPEFTIKTSFYLQGELSEEGVLCGDLIIYGRGDPNLSGRFMEDPTAIFQQVVDYLKLRGLREVQGDIVGDDSYFDSQYYGPWPVEDAYKWYAARVSALSFNDNCIDIRVLPGDSPGEQAKVIQSPETSYANVINGASTTSRRGRSVWASPGGNESDVHIKGKIWAGKKEQVLYFPVETPPLYAATVFKETLERNGIHVLGRARGIETEQGSAVRPGAIPIVEYESLPLSELIKVVNKRSQNLHAELLLKQVGLHTGRGPTFQGGAMAVEAFLRFIGITPGTVNIYDGSGLCRSNYVTAHSITQLLRYMAGSEWGETFRESLAIAGVDESLHRMSDIVPPGKVAAKTGSLSGVFAFSGYALGDSEELAFSIIVNDFEGSSYPFRQARDRICRELVHF